MKIELLSEVLNEVCLIIEIKKFKNNNLLIKYQNQYQKTINLYELAYMCKEWAFKQGYELFSRILSNDHKPFGNCVVYRVEADPEESLTITNEDTEHEAIFKACEWILANKQLPKCYHKK